MASPPSVPAVVEEEPPFEFYARLVGAWNSPSTASSASEARNTRRFRRRLVRLAARSRTAAAGERRASPSERYLGRFVPSSSTATDVVERDSGDEGRRGPDGAEGGPSSSRTVVPAEPSEGGGRRPSGPSRTEDDATAAEGASCRTTLHLNARNCPAGFRMLSAMGWSADTGGLGAERQGTRVPVPHSNKFNLRGLGAAVAKRRARTEKAGEERPPKKPKEAAEAAAAAERRAQRSVRCDDEDGDALLRDGTAAPPSRVTVNPHVQHSLWPKRDTLDRRSRGDRGRGPPRSP
mmetsp:Transcript_7368/g.15955  ORF Transcript_7368/g.15955 Transcript_7368/m.15955 type:complete len:292 (-) Transcript_7368:615-1490(-)